MDPRTSSKVTAPDLLEAFAEGTGLKKDDEDSGTVKMRVFVLYSINQLVVRATDDAFDRFEDVMADVKEHLEKGEGHAVMVVVGENEPAAVAKARKSISAADD